MDSALAWIGKVFEWVGSFIPRWVIVDPTEGGIKYVRGRKVIACSPGVHFYWPVTTRWVDYPVVRQTDRLETQTMETRDGRTFIASGTLTYAVDDITLLVPTTHSPQTTCIDIAMAALHDVLCEMNWDELQSEQYKGTLKTKLKNEAQRQLKDYGVRVIKLQLNSLARARVLKICQSVANEEN